MLVAQVNAICSALQHRSAQAEEWKHCNWKGLVLFMQSSFAQLLNYQNQLKCFDNILQLRSLLHDLYVRIQMAKLFKTLVLRPIETPLKISLFIFLCLTVIDCFYKTWLSHSLSKCGKVRLQLMIFAFQFSNLF